MSQITGVGGTEYIANAAAAKRSSSEKSERSSKETEGKSNASGTSAISTASTAATDNLEYQTILSKANNGQQLTSAELAILKEKNPAAYAKAIRAEHGQTVSSLDNYRGYETVL